MDPGPGGVKHAISINPIYFSTFPMKPHSRILLQTPSTGYVIQRVCYVAMP